LKRLYINAHHFLFLNKILYHLKHVLYIIIVFSKIHIFEFFYYVYFNNHAQEEFDIQCTQWYWK